MKTLLNHLGDGKHLRDISAQSGNAIPSKPSGRWQTLHLSCQLVIGLIF